MSRETTEAEFVTQVLQSEGPVLVRFEAEWSAPCRQLFPIMGQLASEFSNRLMVVTVDVDEQPEIAGFVGSPNAPARSRCAGTRWLLTQSLKVGFPRIPVDLRSNRAGLPPTTRVALASRALVGRGRFGVA
jgi:thiol-disulfide isomerase/thioredoxin